nr:isoleucine N-monooxygenase 1-like [Ipomoea batatas]
MNTELAASALGDEWRPVEENEESSLHLMWPRATRLNWLGHKRAGDATTSYVTSTISVRNGRSMSDLDGQKGKPSRRLVKVFYGSTKILTVDARIKMWNKWTKTEQQDYSYVLINLKDIDEDHYCHPKRLQAQSCSHGIIKPPGGRNPRVWEESLSSCKPERHLKNDGRK